MTLHYFLFLALVSSKHYIVETEDDGTKQFTSKKAEDYQVGGRGDWPPMRDYQIGQVMPPI